MATLTGIATKLTPQLPLGPRTWFRLGGPAEHFAEPQTADELIALVARCKADNVPVRMLGSGSNLLVREEGVKGVVISIESPCFQTMAQEGSGFRIGAGVQLATAINETVRLGLAGLDTLVGIPGTIGGALHNNAGTRAGDIGQWAASATVVTRSGEVLTRTRDELVFAYRQSSLDELVILDATFELERDEPEVLTKRMQKQWIVKKANQPMSHQRTGQIFRNPRGMSAGMLIDQAGLKGATVGAAEVSQKHGNFIVAHDGATTNDVLKLIDLVSSRVAERLGVELEPALEIW